MNKPKRFWKNKRVLVTGFEGFLGSNLTKTLIKYGALVTGLDIKVNRKQTIFIPSEYKKIKVIKGDVADFRLVKDIITRKKIDVVFHLAAEAIVEKGYGSPLKAFKSNIFGTWSILEACRQTAGSLEAIIVASSDKAYGENKKLPYKEDFPLNGRHPYDVSKSCADLIALTYAHSYNLPVAITRCGNIYGPGDFNFSRLIPDAIRCAINGKTLLMRSDGSFTRDYIYVDDIVVGYLLLAEKLAKLGLQGEAFNFSDENPQTVKTLVKKICKLTGKKENYRILNKAKFEIPHQYLSSSKARKILNWKPDVGLISGLKQTIFWYEQHLL